jgi:hypothetical protein
MNLTQLLAAVRVRCGFNANDSMHTDAALTVLINEALFDLADEHDWPWLTRTETLTCTPGTRTVAPNASYQRTVAVTDETIRFRLRPVNITEVRHFGDRQGRPEVFAYQDGELVFAPIPDSAYAFTHDYIRGETQLAAGTDTPTAPDEAQRAIVSRAAYLAFIRENNVVEAKLADDEYRSRVRRLTLRQRRSGSPTVARVRPGSAW